MEFFKDSYRTLFGRTPVIIEGSFRLDETIARVEAILSPRFFSEHLQRTVKGSLNGGQLNIMYGYSHHFRGVGMMGIGRGAGATISNPRLVGKLETVNGKTLMRGHLEVSWGDKINAAILVAFSSICLILSLFGLAMAAHFFMLAFIGIIFSVSLLFLLLNSSNNMGKKLTEMLQWVMTEPLE